MKFVCFFTTKQYQIFCNLKNLHLHVLLNSLSLIKYYYINVKPTIKLTFKFHFFQVKERSKLKSNMLWFFFQIKILLQSETLKKSQKIFLLCALHQLQQVPLDFHQPDTLAQSNPHIIHSTNTVQTLFCRAGHFKGNYFVVYHIVCVRADIFQCVEGAKGILVDFCGVNG